MVIEGINDILGPLNEELIKNYLVDTYYGYDI